MQGFTNGNNDTPQDIEFVKNTIKELTNQVNNNIIKLINIEVILQSLLESLIGSGIINKDEFDKIIQEKGKQVQKDIENDIQKQSAKFKVDYAPKN